MEWVCIRARHPGDMLEIEFYDETFEDAYHEGVYIKDKMFCIDNIESLSINGGWGEHWGRELAFGILPCNQIDFYFYDDPNGIQDDCIADLEQQQEYLQGIILSVWVT